MGIYIVMTGIGFVGGVLSGFLGIGGGIITAPFLLYLPSFFGQAQLSMHVVSGLTISQALFASFFSAISHGRRGLVDRKLAVSMSIAIFAAALIGAGGSRHFSHRFLLGIFFLLALAAAALIFLPGKRGAGDDYVVGSFSLGKSLAVSSGVGLLGGLVGQGGSFILIPMMTAFLNVPIKVAMGSNLVIIFFSSLAGFIGKAATGQVSLPMALALLLGVLPGSLAGSRLSREAPARTLRLALGGLILLACVRILTDLLR